MFVLLKHSAALISALYSISKSKGLAQISSTLLCPSWMWISSGSTAMAKMTWKMRCVAARTGDCKNSPFWAKYRSAGPTGVTIMNPIVQNLQSQPPTCLLGGRLANVNQYENRVCCLYYKIMQILLKISVKKWTSIFSRWYWGHMFCERKNGATARLTSGQLLAGEPRQNRHNKSSSTSVLWKDKWLSTLSSAELEQDGWQTAQAEMENESANSTVRLRAPRCGIRWRNSQLTNAVRGERIMSTDWVILSICRRRILRNSFLFGLAMWCHSQPEIPVFNRKQQLTKAIFLNAPSYP